MIYWDTSVVLKLYAEESDSRHWQDLALESPGFLLSSALLIGELGLALLRKEARGELRRGGAQELQRLFRRDVDRGRFRLLPVGTDILQSAPRVAEECLAPPGPVWVRTLDAIHLATARQLRCTHLATADARMRSAAARLGLRLAACR